MLSIGLMAWGGQVPGQRPRTALVAIYRRGADRSYAKIITEDGDIKYKNKYWLDEVLIYHEWPAEYWPTPAERRKAKLALPIE